jgi:hypothetical protein
MFHGLMNNPVFVLKNIIVDVHKPNTAKMTELSIKAQSQDKR